MRYLIIIFAFILATAHNNVLAAQSTKTAKSYTIQQLVNIAYQSNQGLTSVQTTSQSLTNIAKNAGLFANPSLMFLAGSGNMASAANGMEVDQEIVVLNKRLLGVEVANYDVKQNEISYRMQKAKFAAQISELAYTYKIARLKLEYTRIRKERYSKIMNFLNYKTFASPQRVAEREIAIVRTSYVEADIATLTAQAQIAWNNLNVYLGLPEEIDIADEFESTIISAQHLAEITKTDSIDHNFDITLLQNEVDKLNSQVKLAKAYVIANPSIIMGTGGNGSTNNFTGAGFIGLKASVPIFNRNQYNITAFEYSLKAATLRLEFAKRLMKNTIYNNMMSYQNALRVADIFDYTKISSKLEKIKEADAHFINNLIDFIVFIEEDVQIYTWISQSLDMRLQTLIAANTLIINAGKPELLWYYK